MVEQTLTRKEKLKQSANKFNSEFKKTTNTAIVAAFSFIIGLAWRDVITNYITKITSITPAQESLVSAIIITFFGVMGILIVTKLLGTKDGK